MKANETGNTQDKLRFSLTLLVFLVFKMQMLGGYYYNPYGQQTNMYYGQYPQTQYLMNYQQYPMNQMYFPDSSYYSRLDGSMYDLRRRPTGNGYNSRPGGKHVLTVDENR